MKGFPYRVSLGNSGLMSEAGFFVQDFSKLSTCSYPLKASKEEERNIEQKDLFS